MLRDKLNRFAEQLGSKSDNIDEPDNRDNYTKLAEFLGGEVHHRDEGSFVRIVSDFDESYVHGSKAIYEMDHNLKYLPEHFSGVEECKIINKDNLLFFDMETTGLGGAGTVAFLVGLGSLTKDGMQVRQYFLPDFPDEAAMLEEIRSEFNDDTIIVSYNGKTFDMPILRDRMIIQRVERNLDTYAHVDLLHSTRKLFRLRIGSCTLSNIENKILSFYRDDDIPGELVPAVYFNWLSTSDTELIDKVVKHNLFDIVSLYFLMHHVSEIYHNPVGQIRDHSDLMSMIKIFEKRKEHDKIISLVNEFETILWTESQYDILMQQALAAKRMTKFDTSLAIWEKIGDTENIVGFYALIEQAKYYEHRAKNLQKARETTLRAGKICPPDINLKSDLDKRLKRLDKRISRQDKSK